MTIKDKLAKIVGILSIPFVVACGDYTCSDGTEPVQTPMGSDVCMYDNHVDLNEIDYHFSDVEQKLGYNDTSRAVWVEIVPAKMCQREDGTSAYCIKRWIDCNGYFAPDNLVVVHNGNDTIPLEKTALRFELNRYIKYYHYDMDWYCQEYSKAARGEPSCFDTYVK